jgi:phosphotransferase system  glucose/maltose/N-acetylglucosamine-specific IIC component
MNARNNERRIGNFALTLAAGIALLTVYLLPVLVWMAGAASSRGIVGGSGHTSLIGSFIVAVLLTPLWAFGAHRGVRALLRHRKNASAKVATVVAKAKRTNPTTATVQPWVTGTAKPQAG